MPQNTQCPLLFGISCNSSVSSSMNAMSAVAWKHILEPKFQEVSDARQALVNKVSGE